VIAGPILLLLIPLVMAGVTYLLLRWASLSSLLAVGTALALGFAVITLPMDRPVSLFPFLGEGREIALGETVRFFGRELVLEQGDRMAMAFLFFTSAAIFLLAWRFAPHSLLTPIGLGLLSLLSGALLIQPLIYAALLIEIAAALSIFGLQPEGQLPTRGGMRYLTFTTLALPGLLVTHWLLDLYTLTPDNTGLLNAATSLLVLSFALLLGVVPFHTWVPAMASDGVPLASTFVLTVGNGAVWFMLLDFLETYPWLSRHPLFSSVVLIAGTSMVIVGGLLAPAQRRLGSLMGYAVLADNGATLIALGMSNKLGLALALLSLWVRPASLILMATGLSGLRAQSGGNDSFDALWGLGWKAPWSAAALIMGGVSVAGLPVSAGFVWRWALYRTLAPFNPGTALLVLLASVGVIIGLWRGLFALLTRPRSAEDRSVTPPLSSEGWLTGAVVLVAIAICVGIGLFPQTFAPLTIQAAETYTFFSP